ncbi:hypothetical protein IWX90DRAFT_484667 [Phyllosticta citrichinensis]|uniref:Uncharacterized protein n=1 Tax=Phyllosticta citrichinensis TaxID=1130410 RepID=A0ABR1XZJ9_9PEZI
MPLPDRFNAAGSNGRTLRPTLASSRTSKTPLTPKLASTQSTPSLSASSNRSALSSTSSNPRTAEESLSNNVTPRSSARRSRAGSNQSTPSGTPDTPSGPRLVDPPRSTPTLGYGSTPSRPRSVVSSAGKSESAPRLANPSARVRSRPNSEIGVNDRDSKFFHASAVRSQEPTSAPPAKKSTTFLHSSGEKGRDDTRPAHMASPPLSALGIERSRPNSVVETKFFHANTIPDSKNSSPLTSPLPLSATPPHFGQPSSPLKDSGHWPNGRGTPRPNAARRAPSEISTFSNSDVSAKPGNQRRWSGEQNGAAARHGKSPSLSSIESATTTRRSISSTLEEASSNGFQLDVVSPSTIHSGGAPAHGRNGSVVGKEQHTGLQSPLSLPQSPTSATAADSDSAQNPLQKMNELAANARRERKVLDLEISNSSLLAINRQLEREVRKQKAELKRFRRLSRAGRIPSAGTNRPSILSSVNEGEANDDDELLGLGTSDDESDDEFKSSGSGDEFSSESSTDEGALTPNALAERDAKHLLQDQKRLQLDLSKHREILVDSQKLNQSLKRCLTATELMIKEGKKALDHRIRVSDVQLGGRVLTKEDQNESGSESEEEQVSRGGSLLPAWNRDSAVELNGPKPPPDYFTGAHY